MQNSSNKCLTNCKEYEILVARFEKSLRIYSNGMCSQSGSEVPLEGSGQRFKSSLPDQISFYGDLA